MELTQRIKLEQQIMKHVLTTLAARGWVCTAVNDGGEPIKVTSVVAALALIMNVDESVVGLEKVNEKVCFIKFVRGNAPWEVVSDYTLGSIDFATIMDGEIMEYLDKVEDTYS